MMEQDVLIQHLTQAEAELFNARVNLRKVEAIVLVIRSMLFELEDVDGNSS